jgi:hypothetical protein
MSAPTALIMSAVAPTPRDTGKRIVLNGLLRYLAHRLGRPQHIEHRIDTQRRLKMFIRRP